VNQVVSLAKKVIPYESGGGSMHSNHVIGEFALSPIVRHDATHYISIPPRHCHCITISAIPG
jgi:hypothetical protein